MAFWKTLGSGGTGPYASLAPTHSSESAPGSPPLERNGAGAGAKGQGQGQGRGGEHAPLFEAQGNTHGGTARGSAPPFAAPPSLAAALRLAPFGAPAAGYAQLATPPDAHHDDYPSHSQSHSHSGHTGGSRPGQHGAESGGGTSGRVQVRRDRAPAVDVERRSQGFLQSYLQASEDSHPLPELDPRLYNETFDSVRESLEALQTGEDASRELSLGTLGRQFRVSKRQLDAITGQLATQVMSHHEEMVQGMQLVGDMERDLRTLSIIAKNARRNLAKAMEEVSNDLVVAASVQRKRILTSMIPLLLRMQQVADQKARLEGKSKTGDFAKALRMCSECLVMIEQHNYLSAVHDMNKSIEEWLTRTVEAVDSLLFDVCRSFHPVSYARVVDAYAVMDDAPTLAEKAQNFFAQSVVTETYDTLLHFMEQALGEDDGRRSRLSYNELCLQLPESVFRACLQRTLEVLFEILCSHFNMMRWEHPMAMDMSAGSAAGLVNLPPPRGNADAEGPTGADAAAAHLGSHKRTGSAPHQLENPLQPAPAASSAMPAAGGQPGGEASLQGALINGIHAHASGNGRNDSRDSGAVPSGSAAEEDALGGGHAQESARAEAEDATTVALALTRTGSGGSLGWAAAAAAAGAAGGVEGASMADVGRTGSGSRLAREHRRRELERGSSDKERRASGAMAKTGGPFQGQGAEESASSSLTGDASSSLIEDTLARLQQAPGAQDTATAALNGTHPSAEHAANGMDTGGGGAAPALQPSGAGSGSLSGAEAAGAEAPRAAKGGAKGEAMVARSGSVRSEQAEQLGDIPPKVARRMRRETTATVRGALEKGRKAVWELASRRVSSLLSSDALCSGSSQQFLQSLEWVDRFILAGESFTQSEAVGLRAKVAKQSERYFKIFHLQNLEVLRMIIERESWQRLPPSALSTLTLTGLIGAPHSFLSTPALAALASAPSPSASGAASPNEAGAPGAGPLPPRPPGPAGPPAPAPAPRGTAMVGSRSHEGRWSFVEWMERGNPFSQSAVASAAAGAGGSGDTWRALSGTPPGLPAPAAPASTAGEPNMVGQTGQQASAAGAGLVAATAGAVGSPDSVSALLAQRRRQQQQLQGEEEEDEEEAEELMADSIDDDGDAAGPAKGLGVARARASFKAGAQRGSKGRKPGAYPGMLPRGSSAKRRGMLLQRAASGAGGDPSAGAPVGVSVLGLGLALTGASLSLIRLMDRYARLMQILRPIASDIFQGLCQLFELYFLSIFRLFGNKDALLSFRMGPSDSMFMPELTPKLRSTLARANQALEQQQQQQQLLKSKGPGAALGAPGASHGGAGAMLGSLANGVDMASLSSNLGSLSSFAGMGSPSGPAAQLLSANNLYALRERCVAMESLVWLADVLEESRQRLQHLMPPTTLPTVDAFYTRTMDAVPDLWEHVLRTLTRRLLNVGSYPDRIAASSWEIKQQLGSQHNQYVEALLAEFQLFMHKLGQSGTPPQVQGQLMEYAVELLGDVLLEGYARVKRCTNEGRALMSLDLQVLTNGLQQLTGRKPDMQLVENYVKAFYLPETEFLHWARTHPEYNKSQVVSLISLVATVNNWKRKAKVDLLERIETGDYFS